MDIPGAFAAPKEWSDAFSDFAAKAGVPKEYRSFEHASSLASKLFDPILDDSARQMTWNREAATWKRDD